MDYNFLKTDDFEYVGYKYEDPSLINRTAIHKKGKKLRIYYYLPDGNHNYFSKVPPLKTKREIETYIVEFNHALSSGYLPKLGADILRKSAYDPKDGIFSIFFEKYFNCYSVKERKKGKTSNTSQKSVANRVVPYFQNIGITSICDITDEHLEAWDKSLEFTPKTRGYGVIAPATRNTWRKTLRAFLNTAKEQGYALRCNPMGMNIYEYTKGGKIDITANSRLVAYPLKLIEAVVQCSYTLDLNLTPDIRKIIRFWREVGVRPMEMLTLSDKNIVYKNGHPAKIKIMDLENCPNGDRLIFEPKHDKSYREVALTDWGSLFIESILSKFKGIKRYGKYQNELLEFPFLFVFWDEKEQKFVRNDQELLDLFKKITAHATKEFNLNVRDDYVFYDLRRSCNLYIKLELGYSVEEASAFLGHSVTTNLLHYSLDEDKVEIEKIRGQNSLKRAANANPEVKNRYSLQFEDEKQSAPAVKSHGTPWEGPEIELESLHLLNKDKAS